MGYGKWWSSDCREDVPVRMACIAGGRCVYTGIYLSSCVLHTGQAPYYPMLHRPPATIRRLFLEPVRGGRAVFSWGLLQHWGCGLGFLAGPIGGSNANTSGNPTYFTPPAARGHRQIGLFTLVLSARAPLRLGILAPDINKPPRFRGGLLVAVSLRARAYAVAGDPDSRARTASSTRSVWVSTFTRRQAWRTMPSGPMMKVERSMPQKCLP